MSGPVKAGLIFGLIGIVAIVGVSFIPVIGAIVCGPGTAAILGAVAGYFGVRWGAANSGVGSGVLAGTIAGAGTLIGSVIFFVIAVSMISSMPGFNEAFQEGLRQQQPNSELRPEDLNTMMGIAGPIAGFCFGLLNLLIALALGALGGWLAVRNRTQTDPIAQGGPPSPTSF